MKIEDSKTDELKKILDGHGEERTKRLKKMSGQANRAPAYDLATIIIFIGLIVLTIYFFTISIFQGFVGLVLSYFIIRQLLKWRSKDFFSKFRALWS